MYGKCFCLPLRNNACPFTPRALPRFITTMSMSDCLCTVGASCLFGSFPPTSAHPNLLCVASGWDSHRRDSGSLYAHTQKVPFSRGAQRLSQVPMPSVRCHAAASNPGGCIHTRVSHEYMLPSRPPTLSASNKYNSFGTKRIHFRCGLTSFFGRLHLIRYLLRCGSDNGLLARLCPWGTLTPWNAPA